MRGVQELGEQGQCLVEFVELVASPRQLIEAFDVVLRVPALVVDGLVVADGLVVVVVGEREVAEEQVRPVCEGGIRCGADDVGERCLRELFVVLQVVGVVVDEPEHEKGAIEALVAVFGGLLSVLVDDGAVEIERRGEGPGAAAHRGLRAPPSRGRGPRGGRSTPPPPPATLRSPARRADPQAESERARRSRCADSAPGTAQSSRPRCHAARAREPAALRACPDSAW